MTLYLVMGDGGLLHERSDWGDQVDGVIHILYQLFGVGALAHRGLTPFIGGLCGDHSPHRTAMTQTKCCPILHFGLWWLHLPVVSHGTEDSVPLAALKNATECAECDGGLKVPQFLFIVPSEDIPLVSCRRHLCRGAEAVSSGPANL